MNAVDQQNRNITADQGACGSIFFFGFGIIEIDIVAELW
jgi:hypothetical protein